MLGCVLNDIEHNFIDSVSAKRILQWRVVIQELISVGFAVEFVLEHLREVARAFFMRRVQPVVDAIDARIELLKKEVANLEGRRERLLSGVSRPSRFRDQSLISGLHVFSFSPFLYFCYVTQNTYMFPAVVTWLVFATVWVCNNATLCYLFFTIIMT